MHREFVLPRGATGEQIASRKLKAGLGPSRGILNISLGPAFMCMHIHLPHTHMTISNYRDTLYVDAASFVRRWTHVSPSRVCPLRIVFLNNDIISREINSRQEKF